MVGKKKRISRQDSKRRGMIINTTGCLSQRWQEGTFINWREEEKRMNGRHTKRKEGKERTCLMTSLSQSLQTFISAYPPLLASRHSFSQQPIHLWDGKIERHCQSGLYKLHEGRKKSWWERKWKRMHLRLKHKLDDEKGNDGGRVDDKNRRIQTGRERR